MTDAEWLACADTRRLVAVAKGKGRVSERKLRLFACACTHRVWGLLDERGRTGVLAREQYEDGRATAEELRLALLDALEAQREARRIGLADDWMRDGGPSPREAGPAYAAVAAYYSTGGKYDPVPWSVARAVACTSSRPWREGLAAETEAMCGVLRDVIGNPFRPVAFDLRWRTADTVGLARGIYEECAHDRLPLLADALMDAGCDDERLLAHCRSTGHVRGCWVVDLILDRE